jgi:hypothetical protein
MPDTLSVHHPDALDKTLAAFAASQQRHLALLRTITGALLGGQSKAARALPPAPSTPHALSSVDVCDCEICGSYVPADQMSGFAWRHGAVVHVNCLTAQMDARPL